MAASAATVLTGGKLNLSPEQQVGIVVAIQTAQSLATWVMRTWFTKSVTPAAVAR